MRQKRVNRIGLERKGFSKERIEHIRSAFRLLQSSSLNVTQAIDRLAEQDNDDVKTLVDFVRASERGVIVKRARDDSE